MSVEEWRSQIKRGTLEYCILLMIRQAPRYGYEIITRLEAWPILAARESTIYPLLRRLMKEGFLTAFWQETAEGLPPRKYYTITPQGLEYLEAMNGEWNSLVQAINGMKGE